MRIKPSTQKESNHFLTTCLNKRNLESNISLGFKNLTPEGIGFNSDSSRSSDEKGSTFRTHVRIGRGKASCTCPILRKQREFKAEFLLEEYESQEESSPAGGFDTSSEDEKQGSKCGPTRDLAHQIFLEADAEKLTSLLDVLVFASHEMEAQLTTKDGRFRRNGRLVSFSWLPIVKDSSSESQSADSGDDVHDTADERVMRKLIIHYPKRSVQLKLLPEELRWNLEARGSVTISGVGIKRSETNVGQRLCMEKPQYLLSNFFSIDMPYKDNKPQETEEQQSNNECARLTIEDHQYPWFNPPRRSPEPEDEELPPPDAKRRRYGQGNQHIQTCVDTLKNQVSDKVKLGDKFEVNERQKIEKEYSKKDGCGSGIISEHKELLQAQLEIQKQVNTYTICRPGEAGGESATEEEDESHNG
ncbi:hypothetical protein AALP_AA8G036300 [Arabis alpina]|uniref:Uncharacterized protein n=1 Tax=Arabis alpina TaxID=50452 RepID=A0A087G4S4_ARAAL|nr:hypothetical protein AALP_AA8G036300 [Arabis alpina]